MVAYYEKGQTDVVRCSKCKNNDDDDHDDDPASAAIASEHNADDDGDGDDDDDSDEDGGGGGGGGGSGTRSYNSFDGMMRRVVLLARKSMGKCMLNKNRSYLIMKVAPLVE